MIIFFQDEDSMGDDDMSEEGADDEM